MKNCKYCTHYECGYICSTCNEWDNYNWIPSHDPDCKNEFNEEFIQDIETGNKQIIKVQNLLKYSNDLLSDKFNENEIVYNRFNKLLSGLLLSIEKNIKIVKNIAKLLSNLSYDKGNPGDKIQNKIKLKYDKINDLLNINNDIITEINICIINIFDLESDVKCDEADVVLSELYKMYEIIKKF